MAGRKKSRSQSAEAVDRQLARYREMRDFAITSEPRGESNSYESERPAVPPFVVQKHAARQLHYDFRLGWRGVLKSWAIAKGPSYSTSDKRLAVEVEDHPMEYGGFEGTIPKGQYGGGTVMVWDFGEWQPLGDVEKQLAEGNLKFLLNGTKLKGKWALVRMRHDRDHKASGKPNWLLIKERDEYAQAPEAPSIVDLAPNSGLTQRTMEQIAANNDHVWEPGSGLQQPPAGLAQPDLEPPKKRASKIPASLLRAAPFEDYPGFIDPQLAEEARSAPCTDAWIHELKLDGYRIQLHIISDPQHPGGPAVRLFTRKGLDWTKRMPLLARAAAGLDVNSAILDGEVVVLDEQGRSSFSDLQGAFQNSQNSRLVYFAFDLLHLNGRNLRGLPLLRRKQILERLLAEFSEEHAIRYCEHLCASGELVFRKACELGAEGIVSKLASAPYAPGRGNSWVKMKGALKQEFVIGGFTPVARTGRGVGALLLGYYEGEKLLYAGRCGTGFSQATERLLRSRLDLLVQNSPGFTKLPREARENAIWVRPELVAQIAFSGWTNDNLIRQSSFQNLREDKPPIEVVRERVQQEPVSTRRPLGATGREAHALQLAISRPNKILDEASGMTKLQLAEYYLAVADSMLQHIADRPLSLLRCPDGIGKQAFFQKHIQTGLPEHVHRIPIPNKKTGVLEEFLTIDSTDGLIALAQLGVLEIHPWGSKTGTFDTPDRIIFDLDPDDAVSWASLGAAAQDLRSRLQERGLISFLKSTGGKGLHVVVPIVPKNDWPTIKQFAHAFVRQMEKGKPILYTTNMSKSVRTGRIYLDYLRNDREATAIAPFSARAKPGVPVALPLDWEELQSESKPAFHVPDFHEWKQRLHRDPWRGMLDLVQELSDDVLLAFRVKAKRS